MSAPDIERQLLARSRYYDPESEIDPLLRRNIVLAPPGSGKAGDPYVVGASGHWYPVWSVFLIYRTAAGDVIRTLENYEGDLTAEQVEAVRRYTERFPQWVLPNVEAASDGG